ncbi:hypothetical protein NW752_002412 [Fusarium irregulare]|uniref:Ankyrin n=1 Tax=Fusarium irregulare TaxID=2494466 RepID=A0A9W8PFZ9_9HYPO|nr:hypothetical protein NW766_011130 [Fusarium irregulare]KAJ4024958.1 hypothetical protein NW752_002412 [Fusarium irregulare]
MDAPLPEMEPLHEAVYDNDIIRFNHLLEQPEIRTKLNGWLGEKCLTIAVVCGHVEIVKALISLPLSVFDWTDVPNPEGGVMYLNKASDSRQHAVFKLIAETGKVNLSARDEKGATPLHWASFAGSLPIVDFLLEQEGINPDERDDSGLTPLAYAARRDSRDVASRLLEVDGVDPDAEDIEGKTPLYWAALRGNDEFMEILTNSGRVNEGMEIQGFIDRYTQHYEAQRWHCNKPWMK